MKTQTQTQTQTKTYSDLALNIKDIEKLKSENFNNKVDNKIKTLDESLEKYNKNYIDALEAPMPDITLPFSQILTRAVPFEIRTKSGIILNATEANIASALNKFSEAIDLTQEILLVGAMAKENYSYITANKQVRINPERFRRIKEDHRPGVVELEYVLPVYTINNYKYLIIDVRDILYIIN